MCLDWRNVLTESTPNCQSQEVGHLGSLTLLFPASVFSTTSLASISSSSISFDGTTTLTEISSSSTSTGVSLVQRSLGQHFFHHGLEKMATTSMKAHPLGCGLSLLCSCTPLHWRIFSNQNSACVLIGHHFYCGEDREEGSDVGRRGK